MVGASLALGVMQEFVGLRVPLTTWQLSAQLSGVVHQLPVPDSLSPIQRTCHVCLDVARVQQHTLHLLLGQVHSERFVYDVQRSLGCPAWSWQQQ